MSGAAGEKEEGSMKLEAEQILQSPSKRIQARLCQILREETKQKCEAKLSNLPGLFGQEESGHGSEAEEKVQMKMEDDDCPEEIDEGAADVSYEPSSASFNPEDDQEGEAVERMIPSPPQATPTTSARQSRESDSSKLEEQGNGGYACSWCDKTECKSIGHRSHIIFQRPDHHFPNIQSDWISNDDFRKLCRYVITDPRNEAETPRGTHFQCIHCLKLCPPNNDRNGLFIHLVMNHLPQLTQQLQAVQKEVEGGRPMEHFRKFWKGRSRSKPGSMTKEDASCGNAKATTGEQSSSSSFQFVLEKYEDEMEQAEWMIDGNFIGGGEHMERQFSMEEDPLHI